MVMEGVILIRGKSFNRGGCAGAGAGALQDYITSPFQYGLWIDFYSLINNKLNLVLIPNRLYKFLFLIIKSE